MLPGHFWKMGMGMVIGRTPCCPSPGCLSSVISLTHAGQMWTISLAVLHVLHILRLLLSSLSSCLGFRWLFFPLFLLLFSSFFVRPAPFAFCSLLLLTRASLKWLPAMFFLNPTHRHTQEPPCVCVMVIALVHVCVFVPSPGA